VAADSLTVRADSSADTSERPNCARAVDEATAERPAAGDPAADAAAASTITASSTAPASALRAATR
jgi:hypothetical protein